MNRVTAYKSIALVLCLSLLAPAFAGAQDDDEDLKAFATYQLTVANVRKTKAALDELSKLKYEAPVKQDDETFDALIRRIEQNPRMMGILRGAGISAKDFTSTLTIVTAVGMAMAMDPSGKSLPPYARGHQKFMTENTKDVQPLLQLVFGDQ